MFCEALYDDPADRNASLALQEISQAPTLADFDLEFGWCVTLWQQRDVVREFYRPRPEGINWKGMQHGGDLS